VKLLYDENLSPALVRRLSDLFPDSESILRLVPKPVTDEHIWRYAHANGFTIVSQDNDFEQRAIRHGHPPKVVWLRCGNSTVAEVELFLRSRSETIASFLAEAAESLLILY